MSAKASKFARVQSPLSVAAAALPIAEIADPDRARPVKLRVDEVFPDPTQPRKHFDEEKLQQLAATIRTRGQLTAIRVKPRAEGGHEIIFGERRWRACKLAGIEFIDATVKQGRPDSRVDQLVENLVREDLTALEVAGGIRDLMRECEYSQEEAGKVVGLDKPSVSRHLALLELPAAILTEYEPLAHGIAKSMMFELVTLPVKTQLALWPAIRDDRITVKALREAKRDEAPAPKSTVGQATAPIGSLLRRVMRGTGKQLDQIAARSGELTDQHRHDLKSLRDRIDGLLAQE